MPISHWLAFGDVARKTANVMGYSTLGAARVNALPKDKASNSNAPLYVVSPLCNVPPLCNAPPLCNPPPL